MSQMGLVQSKVWWNLIVSSVDHCSCVDIKSMHPQQDIQGHAPLCDSAVGLKLCQPSDSAETYAGLRLSINRRVAAVATDRQTDIRTMLYAFRYGRGRRNIVFRFLHDWKPSFFNQHTNRSNLCMLCVGLHFTLYYFVLFLRFLTFNIFFC